jgi:hypothetical protein
MSKSASRVVTLKKTAIKGKLMDNYYPAPDFTDQLLNALIGFHVPENTSSEVCYISRCNASGQGITNNWYKHMFCDLVNKINSIETIDYLQNDQYDDILTKNVVFIYLVDASAVNTIIECIVRCTPIIVNKHPAVVELLGDKYPLYISGNTAEQVSVSIHKLLQNTDVIQQANSHLEKLNKKPFMIDTFVTDFRRWLTQQKITKV